jgi:hypothetical protein
VRVPVEVIVPKVLFPWVTPFTDHVRVGVLTPLTVAVNAVVVPTRTNGNEGEIVTLVSC